MAGPTVLDLVEITDDLDINDDVMYVIRGTAPGRDRKCKGSRFRPTVVTQDITAAIDLSTYIGDLTIVCNPAADITLTFSNALPSGRILTVSNNSNIYFVNILGTNMPSSVNPRQAVSFLSDGTIAVNKALTEAKKEVNIYSQQEFEAYFGTGTEVGSGVNARGWAYTVSTGVTYTTIPNDTKIIIHADPQDGTNDHFRYDATSFPYKAYLLKTVVRMGYNILIDNETAIIRRYDNDSGFQTIALVQKASCTNTIGTNQITVPDTTGLKEGQKIFYTHPGYVRGESRFYTIIDITGLVVSVNNYFSVTDTSTGTLTVLNEDIQINPIIDSGGGINGLGSVYATNLTFDLQYVYNFSIKKIVNSVIFGELLNSNEIKANSSDGGRWKVTNCENCDIAVKHATAYIPSVIGIIQIIGSHRNKFSIFNFTDDPFTLDESDQNKIKAINGISFKDQLNPFGFMQKSSDNNIIFTDITFKLYKVINYFFNITDNCNRNDIVFNTIKVESDPSFYAGLGTVSISENCNNNNIKGIKLDLNYAVAGVSINAGFVYFRSSSGNSSKYNTIELYQSTIDIAGAAASVGCFIRINQYDPQNKIIAKGNTQTGTPGTLQGYIVSTLSDDIIFEDFMDNIGTGGDAIYIESLYNLLNGKFVGNSGNVVLCPAAAGNRYAMVGNVGVTRYNDAGWVFATR